MNSKVIGDTIYIVYYYCPCICVYTVHITHRCLPLPYFFFFPHRLKYFWSQVTSSIPINSSAFLSVNLLNYEWIARHLSFL